MVKLVLIVEYATVVTISTMIILVLNAILKVCLFLMICVKNAMILVFTVLVRMMMNAFNAKVIKYT